MDKIKLFSSEHILSRGTAPIQHELRVNFSRPVLSHTANPMIFRILIAVVSGVNSKQIPALHAHPSSKLIECPISPLPPTIPSPPNDLLVRASTAVLELDCRDYTVLQIARACSVCHVEDHTTGTLSLVFRFAVYTNVRPSEGFTEFVAIRVCQLPAYVPCCAQEDIGHGHACTSRSLSHPGGSSVTTPSRACVIVKRCEINKAMGSALQQTPMTRLKLDCLTESSMPRRITTRCCVRMHGGWGRSLFDFFFFFLLERGKNDGGSEPLVGTADLDVWSTYI